MAMNRSTTARRLSTVTNKRLGVSSAAKARFLLAVLLCLVLARPAAADTLYDVGGHLPDLAFDLTNDHGQRVTAQDYAGKVTLLYFGFAGCGGQCPATLQCLQPILKAAGDAANILFVTVNPRNDTPAILHSYLGMFDMPDLTGLTGSENAIAALAHRYRVAYRPAVEGADIMHGTGIYIFDRQGRASALAASCTDGAAIAARVGMLTR